MKGRYFEILLIFILIIHYSDGLSQVVPEKSGSVIRVIDSLRREGLILKSIPENPEIVLSREAAMSYLQNKYRTFYWNDADNPFRNAIGQLLFFASNNPYDSTKYFLDRYSYDSIKIPWEKFYVWDTIKVKIPVINSAGLTFRADSVTLSDSNLVLIRTDSVKQVLLNNLKADTININGGLLNPLTGFKDTILLVIVDTLVEVPSSSGAFPFRNYNYPFEGDSIASAIKTLISFLEKRDSSIVYFTGSTNSFIPVWLNSGSDKMTRYWLKNEFTDSVTLWVGSTLRNTLGLYLEEGIQFRRLAKQSNFSDAQLNLKTINSSKLQTVNKIAVKPQYWKLRSEASFILNQALLTNWVRGGESSISSVMDNTAFADYTNKKLQLSSNNFVRLKLGFIASDAGDKWDLRKNIDLLETNSKLNHKAFGKFDFSTWMLFKTQIAKGYNYPNDSVPVSKFLNPAIITLGIGLDYKPNKTTSISLSPLSYKATFVTDTLRIDKTKYGIAPGQKSKHEPGISLLISYEFKPYKTITVTNRLQLFTNYIDKPQNIDIDWEMIATAKVNWFTDVRFNTHFIFDDNTQTPEVDKNRKPVLGADGKQKKTARIQFKELLGFTFVFRF